MITVLITMLTLFLAEYAHTFCFGKCIDEKIKLNFKITLIICFFAILRYFNNIYCLAELKILVSLLLYDLLFFLIYKKNVKKVFIAGTIVCVVSILLEFCITFLIAIFVKNVFELNQHFLIKDLFSITLYFSLMSIFACSFLKNKIKKVIAFLEKIINIEAVFIIIVILLNFILVKFTYNYRDSINNIYNILILSIVTILIIISLKNFYNKQIYKIKDINQQERIKKYEEIISDYRELKHNLNNDLLAIKSVATKKAQVLIDEKIKKYNKNYDWVNNFDKMPKGLQGLIYFKLKDINKLKITVEVNNKLNYDIEKKISTKQYSYLCDYIGIVLDNAIDSAKNSKEKVIYIYINEKNKNIKVEITNTFGNNIDLNKIGQKNYSTKEQKSGIGLNFINRNRLKDLSIKKEIINNLFKVTITVKLKDAYK